MIIAITGPILSGKEQAAQYLSVHGFKWHSLSKIIREIALSRKIEPTRYNLKKLGNDLINESPNKSILAQKALDNMKKTGDNDVVIEGLRDVQTIADLRNAAVKFILIGVDAPLELRYDRCRKRNRKSDPQSFEEFGNLDDSENYDLNIGQRIYECMDMADYTIINDSTLEDFYKRIDEVLSKLN